MARTESTMLALGTPAPDFDLSDPGGVRHRLADHADAPALLVIFMSNHCPFVKLVLPEIARLARDYEAQGVGVVGIMSNDVANYPDDAPEKMAEEKARHGFCFPYLYDEDQSVAKAYRAACTPDFYLFDRNKRLYYRGQLDGARPGNGIEPDGRDLRAALDTLLAGESAPEIQKPSLGCNIKWKPGNAPAY